VDGYSIQDSYSSPSEPTEAMTFSLYGLTAFQVQYWDGSAWQTLSDGSSSSYCPGPGRMGATGAVK